jgi:ABC-type antimicrobial peptide transport system permease subunit
VADEYSFDSQQQDREHIYQVMEHHPYDSNPVTYPVTPGLLAAGLQAEIPGIKATCRASWKQSKLITLGVKSIYEKGLSVDSSFFQMFTQSFLAGNPRQAFRQVNSIVVSESMARRFFNSTDIIGKTLSINNRQTFEVTGVVKDVPENATLQFDWLIPFQNYLNDNDWLNSWQNSGTMTYVQLEPATDWKQVNTRISQYLHSKDSSITSQLFLFAMKDWRLYNNFVDGKQSGGRIVYVKLFTTIAWIILLIACINFMNLSTARSEKRAREVGVRKVLGAERRVLILQFLGESLLMTLVAVVMAAALIALVLPLFNTLVEKQLTFSLGNPLHAAGLAVIALLCGLVSGSYPALYLSSFRPIAVLKSLKLSGANATFIRKGLVVFQFTISIVLIISTIIIYQQVNYVRNRQLGYDKQNLIQVPARGAIKDHFNAFSQELKASSLFDHVSLANLNILEMGQASENFSWQGKDPNRKLQVTHDAIGPDYLQTAGLQLIRGRDFNANGSADSLSMIINESMAKEMGLENPIGAVIMQDSTRFTVIGEVKDFIFGDQYAKPKPALFYQRPEWANYIYARARPGIKAEAAIAKLEALFRQFNPGYPMEYSFVDQNFDQLFKSEKLIGRLSRLFALLAILISCLGLFGLAAYTAERRTREIGIRKVLGASVQGLARLLSLEFLKLVGWSILIAFPLGWWLMHQWLQEYAYRIEISWTVFIMAGLAALLIAVFTISFQAIRAASANPVISLKNE